MDMVNKFRAISGLCVLLVGLVAVGETETDETDPTREEAPIVNESPKNSDEGVKSAVLEELKEEQEVASDNETETDSEQTKPYTRLPVRTRINPNQNVDLPQDI